MSTAMSEVRVPAAAADGKPVTWNVDDVPWIPLTGLFINRSGYKTVTDAAYTGNAYSIELTTVGPGGFSPTHVEPHAHLFYVLSGHGEVTVGDEVKAVRPGSVSPISAGVPHSFRNLGDDALEMLVVYHPPRVRKPVVSEHLQAVVHAIRREAEDIVSIELHSHTGEALPPFEAGSHIDLHLPEGIVCSYSLCNPPGETARYVVAVYRVPESRGGSSYIHDQLRVGSTIEISKPRNNFPLNEEAAHSVLIAGGIGITPILSMAHRLTAMGSSVELLYCARSRHNAAFIAQIESLGLPVTWHFNDEQGDRTDLSGFIVSRRADAHFYACGPTSMLNDFEQICARLDRQNAHVERFVARDMPVLQKSSYEVDLRRSGRKMTITPEKSLLQTLLDDGIHVEYGCMQGLCGACKTTVLEGEPEHRDSVLTPSERASNKVMTVCVSGCKGGSLILDI